MRDQRLGGDPTLDQPCRGGALHDAARAGPAGELRTVRHDHPIPRRHHVETFRGVFADHRHHATTAGAGGVLGSQRYLDPRQMRRQRAAARTALRHAPLPQFGIALLRFGRAFGNRLLEVLKPQLQLILRQAFGLAAELPALELQQEVVQSFVPLQQGVAFGGQRVMLGHHRQHQRAQRISIGRQARYVDTRGRHHAANPTRRQWVSKSPLRSELVSNRARRTTPRTAPGRA